MPPPASVGPRNEDFDAAIEGAPFRSCRWGQWAVGAIAFHLEAVESVRPGSKRSATAFARSTDSSRFDAKRLVALSGVLSE